MIRHLGGMYKDGLWWGCTQVFFYFCCVVLYGIGERRLVYLESTICCEI